MVHTKSRNRRFTAAILSGLALLCLTPRAWSSPPCELIYSFNTGDGSLPASSLVVTVSKTINFFYGTTAYGGANGYGTVYYLSQANGSNLGALTTLHAFGGSDGAYPSGRLLVGSDGNLYGTTAGGGASSAGSIFKITPTGVLTTLYSFSAPGSVYPYSNSDGATPYAGLILGQDKNFYGTTAYGGSNGLGTVYRLTPAGQFASLYSFGFNDGANPSAALAVGPSGNLYGTTAYGGANKTGTVFRITTSGTLTTLYSFSKLGVGFFGANKDGARPFAGLTLGSDGNLYGVTAYGGVRGLGTVFQITPAGALTTLYSFGTTGEDGANPAAGLITGLDGNLYGTAQSGGANGNGTVFTITKTGSLTQLYSFSALNFGSGVGINNEGAGPIAGLCATKEGNLFGVTYFGGQYGNGVIYRLVLHPSISNFAPISGPVGSTVSVYGSKFTGATSIDIGAVAASFSVISDSEISFIVPAKAKTGRITVTTPRGPSSSSASFTVTQ